MNIFITLISITGLACIADLPSTGAEDPKDSPHAKPIPPLTPALSPLRGEGEHAEAKGFKNVGVAEFEKLRADKKNRLLDVRTPDEFAAGHIPGAVNIDITAPDFEKKNSA